MQKLYACFLFILLGFIYQPALCQVDTTGVITTNVTCNGGNNGSILYNIGGGPGPIKYSWNNGVTGYATGSCTYAVTVNNPGAALTQFQIPVNVTLTAGMHADFSNIVFMDSIGNLFPFWLTDFPTSTNAKFWVRVPNIPAGTSVFYLSFCGSATTSASNPNTTFEFFDNFDGGSVAAYTGTCINIDQPGESCSYAVDNTQSFSPGYSLTLTANGSCFSAPFDGAGSNVSRAVPMVNDSLVIDYEDMVAVTLYGFCSGGTSSTNTVFADGNNLGNGQGVGQGGSCATNTKPWFAETSLPFAVTTSTTTIAMQTTGGDCDNPQGWFDDVRIRKYRANPPTDTLLQTPQLSLTNLAAGTYTLTLTDINGNTVTRDITITQPAAMILVADSNNNPCAGSGNGLAWAVVNNGTAPYTFLWSNTQTTDSITGLAPSTYTVTVTDYNGCSVSATTHITAIAPLQVTAQSSNATCYGTATGAAWAVLTGGQAPYQYAWTNSGTSDSITSVAAGSYTVTVTDANTCTASASVNVTQPLDITITTNTHAPLCSGASNGSAVAIPAGGTGPYTYNWSNNATTDSISGLAAGTYTVSVADNNLCVKTAQINLTSSNSVTVVQQQITPACTNSNTGSVNVIASGGLGTYTYLWSNGETTQMASGLGSGSISVTATDSVGCTATLTAIVPLQNFAVSVTAQPDSVILMGDQTTLNINGTGAAFAIWQPFVSFVDTGGLSVIAAPSATTVYNVTVTSDNGCLATASIKIVVNPKPEWLIPTAFSPNGDGMNDYFHVILRGPVELVFLRVFNRWGEKVFESSTATGDGWDGTFQGRPQPVGVYVYQVQLRKTLNGVNTIENQTGNVTIIR